MAKRPGVLPWSSVSCSPLLAPSLPKFNVETDNEELFDIDTSADILEQVTSPSDLFRVTVITAAASVITVSLVTELTECKGRLLAQPPNATRTQINASVLPNANYWVSLLGSSVIRLEKGFGPGCRSEIDSLARYGLLAKTHLGMHLRANSASWLC